MDNRIYWVHLQSCVGYCANLEGFLEKYKDARSFYEMGEDEWKNCGIKGIAKKALKNLRETSFEKSEEIVKFCDAHSIHVITPEDGRYPGNLRKLRDFPCVLYVRGDVSCLNSGLRIGVIGSRTPCEYGENATREIVKGLAENNVTVVSGGALGVDSISHKTAIENGSKTVLVMGHGHGTKYLMENSNLRKTVCYNGALVTEYPPYTPVGKQTFPERNRIISGMSEGVVIIEAAERSGTFSTAKHAIKQNRHLFVLPGDINSGNFAGSNALISDGAMPIFSSAGILEKFGVKTEEKKILIKNNDPFVKIDEPSPHGKQRNKAKKADCEQLKEKTEEKIENNLNFDAESVSKNAQIVYNIMSDGVCELDEITRRSELEVRKVLTALVELEMMQAVFMTAPNRYEIKS